MTARPMEFALFRMVFGAYLFIHFTLMLPYAEEIFGREGVLPDPSLNHTAGLFPVQGPTLARSAHLKNLFLSHPLARIIHQVVVFWFR